MNLQIGMDDSGRYVFDRDKLPDDVEPYAEGFVCPPEAILAGGFKSAKDARAFIRENGGDGGGGDAAFVWKRVKNRDGQTEYHLIIDGKSFAIVSNPHREAEENEWSIAYSDKDEGPYETMAEAKEAAECEVETSRDD